MILVAIKILTAVPAKENANVISETHAIAHVKMLRTTSAFQTSMATIVLNARIAVAVLIRVPHAL